MNTYDPDEVEKEVSRLNRLSLIFSLVTVFASIVALLLPLFLDVGNAGNGSGGGSDSVFDLPIGSDPDAEREIVSSQSYELANGDQLEAIDFTGDGIPDIYRIEDGEPQNIPFPPQTTPLWERVGLTVAALFGGITGVLILFQKRRESTTTVQPDHRHIVDVTDPPKVDQSPTTPRG